LIQVIPFIVATEPAYLQLLTRGLSDLTVLRLNAAKIEAKVNIELIKNQWQAKLPDIDEPFNWQGQELWLTGEIKFQDNLVADLVLYDPSADRNVYGINFTATEETFLSVWEEQMRHLTEILGDRETAFPAEQALFTNSLPAFLEFRKGLETLAQAKIDRLKEQGLEHLLQAVAYDPGFFEAVDILILFVFQNNLAANYEYYRRLLERLRQTAAPYPRISMVMAELYFQFNDFEKTGQLLRELVAEFPDFTEGWFRLALYYHSLARYDEALSVLQSLLERETDNVGAIDLMGAIYAGIGETDLAREAWLKVLRLDQSRVNVLNNLGLLAEESAETDQAEAYYQQAITVNHEWWGSYYNYGSFCRRQGRLDEAVVWLEKAGQLNSSQFQIFSFLSMALFDLGMYGDAQKTLLYLLQIAPDNTVRCQALELLGRFDQPEVKIRLRLRQLETMWNAKRRLAAIVGWAQLWPHARSDWYYWYLGGCYATDMGLGQVAKWLWQKGLKYGPGFSLLKQLSLFYWRKKQLKKALPLLEKAYQSNHSDREVVDAYQQTLLTLDKVVEFKRDLQQIDRFKDNPQIFLHD
jgi:tetratricopeptide (TPR) repeat protein